MEYEPREEPIVRGVVSPVDVPGQILAEWREADRQLESANNPGAVIQAISDYLGHLDGSTRTADVAWAAMRRLEWFLKVLDDSITRDECPEVMDRILTDTRATLTAHQNALQDTWDTGSDTAVAAREAFRLELALAISKP